MVTCSLIEDIIANYLPSIIYAVLTMVFMWTLSEKPVKREIKDLAAASDHVTNEVFYY
jgi:hypothetical protein